MAGRRRLRRRRTGRDGRHGRRPARRRRAFAACSGDGYEALRIEAGVPRQGSDLDGTTIPQEAFLERDAVSFTKGCFLGQELVCRIDTRGHVNRYLRRLTATEGDRPPLGAEIVAGDKVVGTVTSSASTGALRWYVRHEVEPPAEVELRWDDHRLTLASKRYRHPA